jgi:hypothetical protein
LKERDHFKDTDVDERMILKLPISTIVHGRDWDRDRDRWCAVLNASPSLWVP